jgi:hypothetical protein
MREESKVYRFLVRRPEGKRLLGRSGGRWEVGIKMDRRKFGGEGVGYGGWLL